MQAQIKTKIYNHKKREIRIPVIKAMTNKQEGSEPTPPAIAAGEPNPSSCPGLPNDGRPQPSKGANADADTWKVVPTRDDLSLFKVVDSAGINVADRFHAQANAAHFM